MKSIRNFFEFIGKGISSAIVRFPLTILSLAGTTALICYMISLNKIPPLIVEKLIFTLPVTAVAGVAAQFAMERFERLRKLRLLVYAVTVLLAALYLALIWPFPDINMEIGIRTFIIVFTLVCISLWLPSAGGKSDFNKTALIHFKSAFTTILYATVLSAGISAIIAAIDILLFRVDSKAYLYTLVVLWVFFAPLYYLSLLPRFGSERRPDIEMMERVEKYPKFLEILISYIAIPLIGAYTLVLLAYFIKILLTMSWPSGQLGPMILAYSAVGLVIFVLSELLQNRFAILYRKVFPKVLIPTVIMQLVSVGIRLNAYGITESRYYLALFGVFSLVSGVILSIRPTTSKGLIALLAAGFAVFSVIPPVDPFTVSFSSQTARLEAMLHDEGMLSDSGIVPKADASVKTKVETTNILQYLTGRGYIQRLNWLPDGFNMYDDMSRTFGFGPTYPGSNGSFYRYFDASLDRQQPISISGFDVYYFMNTKGLAIDDSTTVDFSVDGSIYSISMRRVSDTETELAVLDSSKNEIVSTGFYEFAKELFGDDSEKLSMPVEHMALNVTAGGYRLRIIFEYIGISSSDTGESSDYSFIVLFGVD